jgi:FkbM family methyltransferase
VASKKHMMAAKSDAAALDFCRAFLVASRRKRYVLGRNVYSAAVIEMIDIDGVVDDYCEDAEYCGVPVVKSNSLEKSSLVLNAAGGRPLSAKSMLDRLGVSNLDYFTFLRLSGLPLKGVVFNEGFDDDFEVNKTEYDWVRSRLSDSPSISFFDNLVSFRRTLDVRYLTSFVSNERNQYFEEFLNLKKEGEVFFDVGCFDAKNSITFSRLCPAYRAIYAFEPDPKNYLVCCDAFSQLRDAAVYNVALSVESSILSFVSNQSRSSVSANSGEVEVSSKRLDDFAIDEPTFLKMDIEGSEADALLGARSVISRCRPRLAIAAYHRVGDFYRIPRLVFSMVDDYDLYLRHYTESIYETVMFFIPRH